jgi:hypothetical protein
MLSQKEKKEKHMFRFFSWAFHCVNKTFLGMGNGKAFIFFSMPIGDHLNE